MISFERCIYHRFSYITRVEFDDTYGFFKDDFNKGLYKFKI